MDLPFVKRFAAQALVMAAIGLALFSVKNQPFMAACFSKGLYYVLLALFSIWCFSLVNLIKDNSAHIIPFFKKNTRGLIFSLVLTVIMSISVATHFRVLSDETNYVGVSRSMTFEKRSEIITEGTYYYRIFWPQQRVMEKRPLLFPFTTHLLHVFLGYRAANAFVLNFLTLFAIFSLLYILLRKIIEEPWVYAALILVAAQPIISLTANSGCLDLFQVLFIIISLAALVSFSAKPSKASFHFLWFSLLMLSHVRYESSIFFAITIVLLAVLKKIKWDYFKDSITIAITPLVFLPLVWQRILKFKDFDLPEGIITKAFSLDYFLRFSKDFVRSLGKFDFTLPYATIVNIIGIVSILYFAAKFIPQCNKDIPKRNLTLIIGANVLALWVITMAYYFGDVFHPTSARFFLLFCILFSIFTVFLFREIASKLNQKPLMFVLLSFCAFIYYHPVAIEDRFTNALFITRQYQFIDNFLNRLPNKNFLLIHDRPNHFTVHGYGSVHTLSVNANPGVIMTQYMNRLFENIYVCQEIEYATQQPTAGTKLHPLFELQAMEELQNSPTSYMRISKVVNKRPGSSPAVVPAAITEPAAPQKPVRAKRKRPSPAPTLPTVNTKNQ